MRIMIKLAFCTDGVFPHSVGGMQRHSKLLIEALVKFDIEILVFHPHREMIFSSYHNVKEIYIEGINIEKNYLKECYYYSKISRCPVYHRS